MVYDSEGKVTTSESVDMTIRILDADNDVLFTEDQNDVMVVKGAINVNIGESSGGIPLDILDPSTGTKLIDIEIAGQSPFELMPLGALPYAMWAEKSLTVANDSIGSEQIKNGSIKAEDIDPLAFSDINGQLGDAQLPASAATVGQLTSHVNSTTAHQASAIVVSGSFVTFVATNVQEALQKLDAKLVDAIVNKQNGQATLTTNLASEVTARTDADKAHADATVAHGSDGAVVGLNTLTSAIKAHADLTQGVHGLSTTAGNAIVGTTEKQTLTEKTLESPTITGTVSGGGTYSSPTLTTPTIASFTNAPHNHQDAAGGETLDAAAIASGELPDARVSNTLTIGSSGSVNDTALSSNVTKLGGSIESTEITSLNAAKLTGSVDDTILSANVTKLGESIESGEVTDGTIATGDLADNAVTSAKIQDDTIVDNDIKSDAAIAWSKVSKSGAIPADIGAAANNHTHLGIITGYQIINAVCNGPSDIGFGPECKTDFCPNGMHVMGGGCFASGGASGSLGPLPIAMSFPDDQQTGRWVCSFSKYDPPGGASYEYKVSQISVYAICLGWQ